MCKTAEFFDAIKSSAVVTLATAGSDGVTMRLVSPVYYEGCVLIFTGAASNKYAQLKSNPKCCIGANNFFAQATAQFCGACTLPENENLRRVYSEKFTGAFDEGIEFGGRNSEFILLRPFKLTGWAFESDNHGEGDIPTIPFECDF